MHVKGQAVLALSGSCRKALTQPKKGGGPRLLGKENIFLVLLIFVFRINFYDFRGKLPCFLLLSCCFSFAIRKLARETMRKVGARGAGNTHNAP